MVIKKPYAFLIKNFRLIHGLLFMMLLYLLVKSVGIYGFFSSYASNSYYINQASLASNYISFIMYIVCILVIIVSSVIYFLLEVKNKSNKMYMFVSLFYLILFLFYIYMYSVLNGLETQTLSIEGIRVFRDISLLVLIPQIIFIFIIFGRALGFNLKQFDFRKDVQELQIDVSDSEEVEVTFGDNTYKVKRFFRKLIRLTKYFFVENKIFVIAVASVIVILLGISLFNRINIYTDAYNENQNIQANSLWFNVEESYLTKSDMRNTIINKNKTYLLVKVNVSNKSRIDYTLDSNIFKLEINNQSYSPVFNMSEKFIDIGTTFSEEDIHSGSDKTYIVVFEINDEEVKSDYVFKIKDLATFNSISYKSIVISPKNIDNDKDMGNYLLPNEIKLEDTILKDSKILISSYQIANRFKEEYTYNTQDGKTHKAVYSILPSAVNKSDSVVIRFKSKLTLDDSLYINKYIKDSSDFLYYYGIIRYRYQGNYTNVKLSKIDMDFVSKEYIYMELPKEVEMANKIDLVLLIRGVKYTINLK